MDEQRYLCWNPNDKFMGFRTLTELGPGHVNWTIIEEDLVRETAKKLDQVNILKSRGGSQIPPKSNLRWKH